MGRRQPDGVLIRSYLSPVVWKAEVIPKAVSPLKESTENPSQLLLPG